MKCYNHSERSAVGICKSCGKGICHECVAVLPNGLACKGMCESRVELLNQIIEKNSQTMAVTGLQLKITGLTSILFGVVMLVLGVLHYARGEDMLLASVLGLPGILFVGHGFARLSRKARYPSTEPPAGTK